jgi:hypothetical protein
MAELAKVILNGDSIAPDELQPGLEAGAQAVMGTYRAEFVSALGRLRRTFDFAVYPVLPNAPAYVRDLADLGMAGAALKRLRRLPLAAWFRLAAYGVANVRRVLAQDFGAMLGVMIQMELPAFAPFRPPLVLLHAQMTDLLLACRNGAAFRSFAGLVRRSGAEPGLQTRNFGRLVPRLAEWRADVAIVAAPFNPLGYGMHPSPEECETLLAENRVTVVAEDVLASGAVGAAEAAAYARDQHLGSVALECAQDVSRWGGRVS